MLHNILQKQRKQSRYIFAVISFRTAEEYYCNSCNLTNKLFGIQLFLRTIDIRDLFYKFCSALNSCHAEKK